MASVSASNTFSASFVSSSASGASLSSSLSGEKVPITKQGLALCPPKRAPYGSNVSNDLAQHLSTSIQTAKAREGERKEEKKRGCLRAICAVISNSEEKRVREKAASAKCRISVTEEQDMIHVGFESDACFETVQMAFCGTGQDECHRLRRCTSPYCGTLLQNVMDVCRFQCDSSMETEKILKVFKAVKPSLIVDHATANATGHSTTCWLLPHRNCDKATLLTMHNSQVLLDALGLSVAAFDFPNDKTYRLCTKCEERGHLEKECTKSKAISRSSSAHGGVRSSSRPVSRAASSAHGGVLLRFLLQDRVCELQRMQMQSEVVPEAALFTGLSLSTMNSLL